MKKNILIFVLFLLYFSSQAQKMDTQKIKDIEDKMALKELVDTFSILADVKDIPTQVLLFTEDAEVTSIINGQKAPALKGRKQIGDAFSSFLALFETVYHINGQQVVTLNGDKATGISYCAVTLIGNQNDKKMKTSMGVIYNDEYMKINHKWLIAKRISSFSWQETQEVK